MKVPPEVAYCVGLVAQTLTDAGSGGLTLATLGQRTHLPQPTLAHALGLCIARRYARRGGGRYFAW